MVSNTATSQSLPKTLILSLIMLLLIATVNSAVDYCITNKPHDIIGLVGNESVVLTLGDYARGYNLSFTSDEHIHARPSNPVDFVTSNPFSFDEGKFLLIL